MKRPEFNRSGLVLWTIIALLLIFLVLSLVLRRHETPMTSVEERKSPVQTERVEPMALTPQIDLPARIGADYRAMLPVDKGGRITQILVDRGDEVKAGQRLLTIDARVWDALLERAEIEIREAEKDLRRFEELVNSGAVSTSTYDEVKTRLDQARVQAAEARAYVSQCEVISPVDGFINDRFVEVGEFAPEGAAVLEVVRVDPVKILVDVPEREIGSLAVGDPLHFSLETLGLGIGTGTVSFIAQAASGASHSFTVEARAANPDRRYKPGMIATATLTGGQPSNVIAIPLSAVIPKNGEHFVYIVHEDRAVRRLVKIDRILGERAVLAEGLAAGDELIVDGHRTLIDGESIERINAEN